MTLRFGTFTLDVAQRRLWEDDREIRLAPKAFELLKLLIENRPKALSKDEIISRIHRIAVAAKTSERPIAEPQPQPQPAPRADRTPGARVADTIVAAQAIVNRTRPRGQAA